MLRFYGDDFRPLAFYTCLCLSLSALCQAADPPCDGTWVGGSSFWGGETNWTGGCVPGTGTSDLDTATFPSPSTIQGPTVLLLDASGLIPLQVTLNELNFTSGSFRYIFSGPSGSGITLNGPNPLISLQGAANRTTIDTLPIVLAADSNIALGHTIANLVLSTGTTITSTLHEKLTINEGQESGGLLNQGSITPYALDIQGGDITNEGLISTGGPLTIGGVSGNVAPLRFSNATGATVSADAGLTITNAGPGTTVHNQGSITPYTLDIQGGDIVNEGPISTTGSLTIGGVSGNSAALTFTNEMGATVSAGTSLTIANAGPGTTTVTNYGTMIVGSGDTITISGGTLANERGSMLEASTSPLVLSGGTFSTAIPVSVSTYTQSGTSSLILDFPPTGTPYGNILTTGAIDFMGDGCTLTIADTNFTPSLDETYVLLKSSMGPLTGTFILSPLPPKFANFTVIIDHSTNQVYLSSSICTGAWISSSLIDDYWGLGINWGGGCIPGDGNPGDPTTALFPDRSGTPMITVTLANSGGTGPFSPTLHQINFTANSTQYTIQENSPISVITLSGASSLISLQGSASAFINAPIVLDSDANIQLGNSSSTLTLQTDTTITSSSQTQTLTIEQGASAAGTLINQGSITPYALDMRGGTIENQYLMMTSGSITIGSVSRNTSPLTFTNAAGATLSAEAGLTISDAGTGTAVTNNGTMVTTNGSAITISGGTLNNFAPATLGSPTSPSPLVLSGSGILATTDQVFASTYTQSGSSILSLDFGASSLSSYGNILTTEQITLAGSLFVTNTGNYLPPSGIEIPLLQSPTSGPPISGAFTYVAPLPTPSFDGFTLRYGLNRVYLSNTPCTGDWSGTSSGNWGLEDNWMGGCVPGVNSDLTTATFPDVAMAADTIAVTLVNAEGTSPLSVTLDQIVFSSDNTSYTIQQYNGAGSITLSASNPSITLQGSANAIINAPISLSSDTSIALNSSSTLTLQPQATITSTSSSSVLTIEQGTGSGTLINQSLMSPSNLTLIGGTIENQHRIEVPAGLIVIAGDGNSPLLFTNDAGATVTTEALIIADAGGGTTVVNKGTITGTDSVLLLAGTVTNTSGGQLSAGSGSELVILGGVLTNNQGATLGTSSSDLQLNGGTLVSFDTILANAYTQTSPGVLELDVASPTVLGQVQASGDMTLGGTLIVRALDGFSAPSSTSILLLHSDAERIGEFAETSLLNFPSNPIPTIVYKSNTVILNFQTPTPAHLFSASYILLASTNQHSSIINRKSAQLRNRVAAMHPSSQKSQPSMGVQPEPPAPSEGSIELNQETESFSETSSDYPFLESRNYQIPRQWVADVEDSMTLKEEELARAVREGKQRYNVYVGPIAGFGHIDTRAQQVGFHYASAGALGGFDVALPSNTSPVEGGLGAIVEYKDTWANAEEHAGHFSSKQAHGSLYGVLMPASLPELFFDWIVGFTYTWDHTKRSTQSEMFPHAIGSTHEKIVVLSGGAEYLWQIRNSFSITPLVHLQWLRNHIDGYKEHGASSFNFGVPSQTIFSLISSLGARFNYYYTWKRNSLVLELDGEWQHEYRNKNRSVTFTPIATVNPPIAVDVFGTARNTGLVSLDALFTIKNRWQIETNGSLLINDKSYDAFFFFTVGRLF